MADGEWQIEGFFDGQPTAALSPTLPAGVDRLGDRWVTSQPIQRPAGACTLKGRFDFVIQFDDGSYGVVDFKTSERKPEHVPFYSRQLHAYAYCLEHGQPGSLAPAPVTRLRVLSVEPKRMERTASGGVAHLGAATWQEPPKDEAEFLAFLDRVLAARARPALPPPGERCVFPSTGRTRGGAGSESPGLQPQGNESPAFRSSSASVSLASTPGSSLLTICWP